jgi:hypothetical protein
MDRFYKPVSIMPIICPKQHMVIEITMAYGRNRNGNVKV